MEESQQDPLLPIVLGEGLWKRLENIEPNTEKELSAAYALIKHGEHHGASTEDQLAAASSVLFIRSRQMGKGELQRRIQRFEYKPLTSDDFRQVIAQFITEAQKPRKPQSEIPGTLEYRARHDWHFAQQLDRIVQEEAERKKLRIFPEKPAPSVSETSRAVAAVLPPAPGVLAAAREFLLSGQPAGSRLSRFRFELPRDSPLPGPGFFFTRRNDLGGFVPLLPRAPGEPAQPESEAGLHQITSDNAGRRFPMMGDPTDTRSAFQRAFFSHIGPAQMLPYDKKPFSL